MINNINNLTYINQAHIIGFPHSVSQRQINEIYNQMNNCVCKIIKNNAIGTAFFARIPFPDKYSLLPVLITCHHILDENSISIGTKIKIEFQKDYYSLLIDNSRKKYTNKSKDITIIEIKRNDNIKNNSFLEIDENEFADIYIDKPIYIFHYELGGEIKYSPGTILKIDYDKIMYSCSTKPGSSGGPIIDASNFKVIGVHKGYKNDMKLNFGILIKVPPVKKFNQKDDFEKNLEEEIQIKEWTNESFKEPIKIEKETNEIQSLNEYQNDLINIPNIHDHPFILYDQNNELCNICFQKIYNTPGYKCNNCDIILCLDCSSKIFYGKKNTKIHNHNLKLSRRNNWLCDICGFNYSDKCLSFCCNKCTFNVCFFCYTNENQNHESVEPIREINNTIHKHPLYFKKIFSTNCTFCKKNINRSGYECEDCDIILCLYCTDIIFHNKKTKYIHNHELKLKNREKVGYAIYT